MNEGKFNPEKGKIDLDAMLADYEAEHGVQSVEERTKLMETWKQGVLDRNIENVVDQELADEAENK